MLFVCPTLSPCFVQGPAPWQLRIQFRSHRFNTTLPAYRPPLHVQMPPALNTHIALDSPLRLPLYLCGSSKTFPGAAHDSTLPLIKKLMKSLFLELRLPNTSTEPSLTYRGSQLALCSTCGTGPPTVLSSSMEPRDYSVVARESQRVS